MKGEGSVIILEQILTGYFRLYKNVGMRFRIEGIYIGCFQKYDVPDCCI